MSVLLCFSSCAGVSRRLLIPWLGSFGGCVPGDLCNCVGSGSSAMTREKMRGNGFKLHQGMFRSHTGKKRNH